LSNRFEAFNRLKMGALQLLQIINRFESSCSPCLATGLMLFQSNATLRLYLISGAGAAFFALSLKLDRGASALPSARRA